MNATQSTTFALIAVLTVWSIFATAREQWAAVCRIMDQQLENL